MNKMAQLTGQKGFSLLEILVAFSIMALSLGFLLNIFSKGVYTAALSEDYTAAVQIAESLLARVGVENELQEGQSNGTEYEKYQWTVTNYPYDVYALHNLESETSAFKKQQKIVIFQVIVKVVWGDGDDDNQRSVELNTLKYGANKS